MSAAIFRIMLLGLLRDRGALAISFLVPAAFFVIFSAAISGLSGEELQLEVSVADDVQNEISSRLLDHLLGGESNLTFVQAESGAESVRQKVRSGNADVGLILEPMEAAKTTDAVAQAPRARLVSDSARGIAALLLGVELEKAYRAILGAETLTSDPSPNAVPEAPEAQALPSAGADGSDSALASLLVREEVTGQASGHNHIAYYAGAAAVLFLLFSTVHGAVTLLEEKESGILERLLVGPGSTTVLVNGKFLYLVLQGFVQVSVIFAVAWLGYGIDVPGNALPWAVTTAAASAAAAGLALALATACSTRRQAQAIANVAILVLSALGGSMIPRFLMPSWLQDLGWLTPNTWALEAYVDIFWRDQPLESLLLPWGLLLGSAVLGLGFAQLMAKRMAAD